jgi:hypothetical protein
MQKLQEMIDTVLGDINSKPMPQPKDSSTLETRARIRGTRTQASDVTGGASKGLGWSPVLAPTRDARWNCAKRWHCGQ